MSMSRFHDTFYGKIFASEENAEAVYQKYQEVLRLKS